MHTEQRKWCEDIRDARWWFFSDVLALDVGSADICGTNQDLFTYSCVLGVDVAEHQGVDIISRVHDLPFRADLFDTIICTEMLEHDRYWRKSIARMIEMLKPGGLLVITCAGPMRREHGTPRKNPKDSLTAKIGDEYYGNLKKEDLEEELEPSGGGWKETEMQYARNKNDLYFWGVKSEPVG